MNKSNGNRSREFMMLFGNCMIYMLLRLLLSAPLEAADDNKVCANRWGDSNVQRISSPNEQKCLIGWKTATKHCRGPRAPSSAFVASWQLLHPANLHGPTRQTDKAAVGRKATKKYTFSYEELLKKINKKSLVNNCDMFWWKSNERLPCLPDPSMLMSW